MKLFSRTEYLPVLKTERLTLREMKVTDSSDMYEYSRQSDVTRYLLWREHPNEQFTKDYLGRVRKQYRSGEYYDWAIIYEGTDNDNERLQKYRGHMIGTCGFASFNPECAGGEIGYVLNPALWGHGIIPEAAKAVMDFGFRTLGLNRIEARYIIGNERSRRVMEKLGMCYEGTHRSSMLVKGMLRDIGICAILRSDIYPDCRIQFTE